MHIAIDAWEMVEGLGGGVPLYLKNLLISLAKIDHGNKYTIYTTRSGFKHFDANNFEVKVLPFGRPRSKFWHHVQLWQRLLLDRPDILVSHSSLAGWYCPYRLIFLVYDISFLLFPHFFHRRGAAVRFHDIIYKISASRSLRRAQRIIAIADATKQDLISYFKAREEKISVIYPGFDGVLFHPQQNLEKLEALKRKYEINGRYILDVGELQPRKNFPRLIEAFTLLKRDKGLGHKLVIVGRKGRVHEEVFQTVKRLGVENEVIFTGPVPAEDLPLLYQGADLFAFPSLFEGGFSFPPLEAMACGTPVVVSNISTIPEMLNDAAILVDPYRVEEIAKAMNRVISNDKLKKKLRERGLVGVSAFSWEKTARETVRIFEQVYRP